MLDPIIVRCESRDEWLAERRKSIGASEVAVIFGESPFMTPLRLWAQKTGREGPTEETEAMRMGHLLEPIIAQRLQEESGHVLADPGDFTIYRHPDTPWLHATPDRMCDPDGQAQLKAPGAHFKADWESGAPLHVEIQVQAEMHSTMRNWSDIAALVGGQEFRWCTVSRNQEFIDGMIERCEEFLKLVQSDTPPEATAKDTSFIAKLYPEHAKGMIIEPEAVDEGFFRHVQEYDTLKEEVKHAQSALDYHEAKIKMFMGEAEILNLPDGSAFTWKTQNVKEFIVKAHTTRPLKRKQAKS